ncbi:hypothetical protein DN595_26695 [Enterobacter cloacae]|uniref:SMODS and SLOG-associating 2TM effector domain-containing protein n=2 Tax=Enterobacter cloacae TaxID=550 RepID=A0AB37VB09_ENTCL|nr:hypothetical protein DN595_26695 [Enterobacter cloacae]
MMSLWDALRMNMMISYQELVRTFPKYIQELEVLMQDFDNSTITKQICGSNWYAHYKFYSELEKRWIEEQLSLTFWKDKFPNTLKIFLIIILGMVVFLICHRLNWI